MGIIDTVSEIVSDMEPERDVDDTTESKGAYWCDDCSVRIRDVEVNGDGPPDCPECGGTMRFERIPDSGSCAC